MKWLKIFEDFKKSKYSIDDIIRCIETDGSIYSDIIKDYPKNDPEQPLRPIDIDDDGNITVNIEGNLYEIELRNVNKIDFEK